MPPNLQPTPLNSELILPPTGTYSHVLPALYPNNVYTSSQFISGAVEIVSYIYQRAGGNILDIELLPSNVYNNYQAAILKYSELINNHHAKNILFGLLGLPTGTFDQNGNLSSGVSVSLMYAPPVSFGLSRQIGYQYANEHGIGGTSNVYSASFQLVEGQQDYNLQEILQNDPIYSGIVNSQHIVVRDVYYMNPRLQWRYFGAYFGNYGYGTSGNGGGGGMWAGSTNMYVLPVWEDKLRAMQYEDALNVRVSNYSYEIKNNKIRIFPIPKWFFPEKMWFKFWIPNSELIDALLSGSSGMSSGSLTGINNVNTLPLVNIPLENINSPGKNFIREYCFWLCMQTLGWVRSKYDSVPIPNDHVTLNGKDLLSDAKSELEKLVKDFLEYLTTMTNEEMSKRNESLLDNDMKLKSRIPMGIFVI